MVKQLYLQGNGIPKNTTMAIASEQLSSDPLSVWEKVAKYLGIIDVNGDYTTVPTKHTMDLGNFTKIRLNAQENKGGTSVTLIEHYKPGLFNVSKNMPMRLETRKILDK